MESNKSTLGNYKYHPWTRQTPHLDFNIYSFLSQSAQQTEHFFPIWSDISGWRQSSGNDINSMIADASFVNMYTHDYRLQQRSLCNNLGIKSIDLRDVFHFGLKFRKNISTCYPNASTTLQPVTVGSMTTVAYTTMASVTSGLSSSLKNVRTLNSLPISLLAMLVYFLLYCFIYEYAFY